MPTLDTRQPDYSADDAFFAQVLPGAGMPNTNQGNSITNQFSYYGQENVSFWKDRVTLVGGLRWYYPGGKSENYVKNTVKNKKTDTFRVHKYGIVLKPTKHISLYYTDAQNLIVASGSVDKFQKGDKLTPREDQKGKLTEFGIKFNQPISEAVRMWGSIVYFDMTFTNQTTVGVLESGQIGDVMKDTTSEGFEFDYGLEAKMGPGTANLIVAYFDGDGYAAGDPIGEQPIQFAPQKFSVIGRYSWTEGPLNGFTIGATMMDQSNIRATTTGGYINTPTLYNVFTRYEINDKWSAQLNINNVTDESYIVAYSTTGLVQRGEAMSTRLTVKYAW